MNAEMTRLRDEVMRLRDSMTPGRSGSADPDGSAHIRPDMQLVNGMMLRRAARTDDEIGKASVVLSRFARGGKDESEKKKIRDRCCAALKNKFVLLDYSKLTDSGTSGAKLGAMVLAQTNALDELKQWAERYDVQYLLMMPDVSDFQVPTWVAGAPKKDLLSEYRSFSPSRIRDYQDFVATWMADVDSESSQWLLEVLQASTSKAILAEIHQEYMALPATQKGGLTLFKMIMDIIHTNTTEHTELFRNYLNTYQLRDTDKEEVPVSVAGFVAVVMMLPENDRPSNLVLLLLNGLESSNQKFNETVLAQRGAINTPMYEQYKEQETELNLLLQFVKIAKRVYYSQLQARNWNPTQSSKTNFFTASSGQASSVIDKQSKSLPPGFENHTPRFVKWFFSKKCSICGKNHPDKFHNDPDMINRPFRKSDRPARSLPSGQSQPKSGFKFKPGKNKEFKKRVYQVASDCIEDFKAPDDVDDEDNFDVDEYMANMADDGDEPGYEHVDDDGDDDHEDSAAMALAALALQGLSIN